MNTNPFEYWVDFRNQSFSTLIEAFQNYVDDPTSEVKVHEIFTDHMFSDLCCEMSQSGIEGIDLVQRFWSDNFRERYAIRGFLLDKEVGAKRLFSMPDRITNSINLADGNILRRPSAISAYNEISLDNIETWWREWKKFMFHTLIEIFTADQEIPAQPEPVCALIEPLLRSKYPAITVEEQAGSVPLQILCLGLMDAIFIFALNAVQPGIWEPLRRELSTMLITNKAVRICSVLSNSYLDRDAILLQEASAGLVDELQKWPALQERFALLRPATLDFRRNQNSLILVSRAFFRAQTAVDVTQQVKRESEMITRLKSPVPGQQPMVGGGNSQFT